MKIPKFEKAETVFGAPASAYPKMEDIPEDHRRGRSKGCRVFSGLFFSGGSLEDHGLRLKPEADPAEFYPALRALMTSFAPPHELKEATCGWLIEAHTEPLDAT